MRRGSRALLCPRGHIINWGPRPNGEHNPGRRRSRFRGQGLGWDAAESLRPYWQQLEATGGGPQIHAEAPHPLHERRWLVSACLVPLREPSLPGEAVIASTVVQILQACISLSSAVWGQPQTLTLGLNDEGMECSRQVSCLAELGFCHRNPKTRSEGQVFIWEVLQKAQVKQKASSAREQARKGWEQAGAICCPPGLSPTGSPEDGCVERSGS